MTARALTLALSRMRLTCAWCQAVISEGVEPESHGICPDCERRQIARSIERAEFGDRGGCLPARKRGDGVAAALAAPVAELPVTA